MIIAGNASSGGGPSLNTKGDVQGYSTTAARLPVGADGKVLNADSTQALGIAYVGGLVQINRITTAASQATVDFTSIPANFQDLEVRWMARDNVAAASEVMSLRVNNDSTSGNYTASVYSNGSGSTASSGVVAASAGGIAASSIVGATGTLTGEITSGITTIQNYLGTTFFKRAITHSVYGSTTGTNQEQTNIAGGTWQSTAAITRLTFNVPTTFLNGSVFTLYGVGAA